MSVTIDVSAQTAQRLQEAAAQCNVSVQEYLRRLIESALNGNGGPSARSGADLVRQWRNAGVIGAWRNRADATDSVALADQMRHAAQSRTRE